MKHKVLQITGFLYFLLGFIVSSHAISPIITQSTLKPISNHQTLSDREMRQTVGRKLDQAAQSLVSPLRQATTRTAQHTLQQPNTFKQTIGNTAQHVAFQSTPQTAKGTTQLSSLMRETPSGLSSSASQQLRFPQHLQPQTIGSPKLDVSLRTSPFLKTLESGTPITKTDRVFIQARPLGSGPTIPQHSSVVIAERQGAPAKAIFTYGPDTDGNVRLIPGSKAHQRDLNNWMNGGDAVIVQEYNLDPTAVVRAAKQLDEIAEAKVQFGEPIKYRLGSCNCNTYASKTIDLAAELSGSPTHHLAPLGTRVFGWSDPGDSISTLIGWGAQHREATDLERFANRIQKPVLAFTSDISGAGKKTGPSFAEDPLDTIQDYVKQLYGEGKLRLNRVGDSLDDHLDELKQEVVPQVAAAKRAIAYYGGTYVPAAIEKASNAAKIASTVVPNPYLRAFGHVNDVKPHLISAGGQLSEAGNQLQNIASSLIDEGKLASRQLFQNSRPQGLIPEIPKLSYARSQEATPLFQAAY